MSEGTVEAVKAGESFTFLSNPNEKPVEVVVEQSCCSKTGGFWHCVSCDETPTPRTNLQKDIHISKSGLHRLVWVCHEHGPEEP